ncbi:MAG: low affinity iron permease family protein [Rhodanobacter sp.]
MPKRSPSHISQVFRRFAESTARQCGRPLAFLLAASVVVVWAASGPLFHFGDTWQLVINTGTTIVTFLMVFLIQNSQNRDSAALQIKLDELIRTTAAHNSLLAVEDLDEDALDRLREQYRRLAAKRAESQPAGTTVELEQQQKNSRKAEEVCVEINEIERELGEHAADHAADISGGVAA